MKRIAPRLRLPEGPRTRRERAASLVEYALLLALIAIVCLIAILFFGEETSKEFESQANSIREATD